MLQTFEDWGRWDEEFQTKATSLHLWGVIDPDSDEALLEKPDRPEFGDYYRRIPARTTESESQTGRQTRHHSSHTLSQPSTADPIIALPETIDINHRARNLSELTADDRAAFMFEWRIYEQDYREYKEQETNSEKLKAWVTDTVDYGLRQSSCLPMWDLRKWYNNLKRSVGATEREQQTAARRKYQAATAPLTKVPKDFAGWITTWEMATNHALVRRTGGVEDPNTWFDDLTKAIQPILASWVAIYAGIYKEKLEEKTLTIGEVAKDLRKEAERRNLLQSSGKGSRIQKGVFGPTFAGEPPSPTQQGPEVDERSPGEENQGNNRKRKARQATAPRKKGPPARDHDTMCRACDGNHPLAKCYYAFPQNAPDYFHERRLIRDAVEHRINTDTSLRDEINRVRKTAHFKDAA